MSVAVQRAPRYDPTRILAVTLVVSFGVHAAYVISLRPSLRDRAENKPIEIELFEVKPPPPPPPEPEPEPEKPKPPPPPPPKIKVAVPKPVVEEPPPPTEEAPKEEAKPPPIFIGVSMSGTSSAGTFSAPVGNSAMGGIAPKAPNPEEVKPYKAPKYVPPGGADSDPEVAPGGEFKIPYPDEAKKAGVEGTVRLRITVDFEGHVTEVKILNGPGYGLDEAAREALKRFKFRPAMKAGEAVSTTITYNYTFLLD
jgi:protein TonB